MIPVSAIIPTLSEEERIEALLTHLQSLDSTLEIIVADGGSRDGTAKRAEILAQVIQAPRGRASQMNAAARLSKPRRLRRSAPDGRYGFQPLDLLENKLRQKGGRQWTPIMTLMT